MKLEIVQKGSGDVRDLMIWSMGDIQADLREGAPKDTIVYYFNGAGTSKYEDPPSIEGVIDFLVASDPSFKGVEFKTVTLAAWSAGGRAVQRQLQQALRTNKYPDAVLIADGLYASYLNPSQKTVDFSKLQWVADYMVKAANEPEKFRCILWHSDIFTPGYASSGECIHEIKMYVEKKTGKKGSPEKAFKLDGRPIKSYWTLGGAVIIGYAGKDKNEHIAEVHMIDEVMKAYCPWFSDENKTNPDATVHFPGVTIGECPKPHRNSLGSLGQEVVAIAKRDFEANVTEYDARVTAMLAGVGLKPPNDWCAAAIKKWIEEACKALGIAMPIEGSPGALATMVQFQKAKFWIPKNEIRSQDWRPGMVTIWRRPGGPGWWGHIGVIEKVITFDEVMTYEGNSNNKVSRNKHRLLNEPLFLGVGVFPS